MELSNVLLSPVVTEKSTHGQKNHKYTFLVRPNSNKIEVAKAIESIYGVKVTSVNIIPVLKKVRMVGRSKTVTKRRSAKKAIITVAVKQAIDFNKFSKKSK